MFVCFATGNTGAMGNIAFEMHVNGSNQLTYGFGGFEVMTLHEVIPASALNQSPNQLFVKVLAGDGQLQIGDVVLKSTGTSDSGSTRHAGHRRLAGTLLASPSLNQRLPRRTSRQHDEIAGAPVRLSDG